MENSLFFTASIATGGQVILNKRYIVSVKDKGLTNQVEVSTINGDVFSLSMDFLSIWAEINLVAHRTGKE